MPLPLVAGTWSVAVATPWCVALVEVAAHGMPASLSGFIFRVGVPSIGIEFVVLAMAAVGLIILERIRHARDAHEFAPHQPAP